jgi:hypothetical protein
MSEYQCENCSSPISAKEKVCPKCDYPHLGSKPEKISYNTRLMKLRDLVEESEKSVKSVFSLAIIFVFMSLVVLAFSLLFHENHYQSVYTYLLCGGIYYVLSRLGHKSTYLMAALALVFYLGHTIFEISSGMVLKSPVELDKSFTETRGASLFFALIPLAYLLFRLALMIVLAKFLWTELKMKRFGKMLDFVKG